VAAIGRRASVKGGVACPQARGINKLVRLGLVVTRGHEPTYYQARCRA